jgi:hypothetical protein
LHEHCAGLLALRIFLVASAKFKPSADLAEINGDPEKFKPVVERFDVVELVVGHKDAFQVGGGEACLRNHLLLSCRNCVGARIHLC